MTIEITLETLVRGVYEDIEDRFRPNQVALYHMYEIWDGQDNDPDITVCMRNDCRYALVKFELKEMRFKTTIIFYTQWVQLDEEYVIDLTEPQGLSKLADWLVAEIIDGLKRGWSGREKKRIA